MLESKIINAMTEGEMDFTDAQLLRKKALDLIGSQKVIIPLTEVDTDYKKLLYEIKVQQAALELQNEALCQANDKLEAALKKYTMLFDLAAMGYFVLEADGTIIEVNFTAAEMLRERHFSLVGINFDLFVSTDSRLLFNHFIDRVYRTKARESCTVFLGYEANPLCLVYVEGILIDDEQCLLSVVNLSRL